MGACPCPRCLILKDLIPNLGMPRDRQLRTSQQRKNDISWQVKISSARDLIYKQNYAVDSTAVEKILKEQSLVPISVCARSSCIWFELMSSKNAFAERLGLLDDVRFGESKFDRCV